MEIIFTWRKNVYSLAIGHETAWFEQMSFIIFTRLYFDKAKQVEYAVMLWHS